jgi:phosphoribosylanthranilate isomerase
MRIKLCGVRTPADALLCAQAGADEIGVIFAAQSRRRVTLETARAIRDALPAHLPLVGVFLDASAEEVLAAARAVGLAAAQLHGAWPGDAAAGAEEALAGAGAARPLDGGAALPLYAALQVDGERALEALARRATAARVLLDGPAGGSGQTFAWSLATRARALHKAELFIAGGLTPENVAQAIREAQPDGVDVASGIEGPDGFKDAAKVRAFVAAARKVARST